MKKFQKVASVKLLAPEHCRFSHLPMAPVAKPFRSEYSKVVEPVAYTNHVTGRRSISLLLSGFSTARKIQQQRKDSIARKKSSMNYILIECFVNKLFNAML